MSKRKPLTLELLEPYIFAAHLQLQYAEVARMDKLLRRIRARARKYGIRLSLDQVRELVRDLTVKYPSRVWICHDDRGREHLFLDVRTWSDRAELKQKVLAKLKR